MLRKMEWEIHTLLAGPFARAAALGSQSKKNMRWDALLGGGAYDDYRAARAVLVDYNWAMRREYGMSRFEDRTRDLVLAHWPAIDALALALLKSETLEHDAAYAIVAPLLDNNWRP